MTALMTIVWLQLAVACQLAAAACDRHITCPETCELVRNTDGCASCNCTAAPACQGVTCADNEVCQLIEVQCIRAPCPPLPLCVPRAGSRTTTERASRPAGAVSPSLCWLPYDAGSCQNTHVRYYYDAAQRACRQFNYSGCLGNDNNFLNLAHCMAVCGGSSTTARPGQRTAATPDLSFAYCQLDADYGLNCKPGNETAWFYNRTSGACETFQFGGCLGNQNRFMSRSICHSVCVLRVTHRPHASVGSTTTTTRTTSAAERTATPPVTALRPRSTLAPWSRRSTSTACRSVNCAGKDCTRSGFATDLVGCPLCICADPCEESPCPVNTECVRMSKTSRATLCVAAGSTSSNVSPAPTSTSRPSGECPDTRCGRFCATGFVKDENGCDTCHCVDPCQLMSCADGTECVIETLDANTTACVGDMCGLPYRAQCVASTTPLLPVSTPAVNRTRDDKFRSCCEREMVDPVCHRLCSRGSLLSLVNDPALFGCLRHLTGLLGCVVDGVDRTECCASNGMSGQCLGACSGNVTDLPANLLVCQAHMFTFASCYDVPLPPLSSSPELSTTTGRPTTVSSARDAQFTSCCVAEGVVPYCHKLCSYRGLLDAEDEDLIICSSSLRRIAACGTNGDNVTHCCASNGLTGDCLDICSGDIANFPADVLDCQQYIDTYALCYDVLQSTTSAPTTSARRCPPTTGCTSFSLRCQYGLARDAAGCETCSCYEPCRKVECAEGSVCTITSHTVCELDMCHLEYSGQCVAACEPLNCSNPYAICRYGHVKNSTTGCDTCPCHQPCQNVTCEQGYVCEVNAQRTCHGGVCNTEYRSSCVVDCPVLRCGMYQACPYGFLRNANGCETCQCYQPCQGATCPAGTVCQPSNTPIIVAENGRYRRVYTYSCTPIPSSRAPTTTATTPACTSVRCRMYCRFGWAKDNITGCDICACRNPCHGVTCQPGSVCEPTLEIDTYVGLCVSIPSSPAPPTTPACKPVLCRLYCPFGWAKDITTGCDICACHNPCHGVTCQPGSVCEPTLGIDTYVGLCVPRLSSSLPTAASTPACQPVLCDMYCPFGWAKDLNTGCDICACHNPCHDVRCHPGSECQPTFQDDRHVGVCVESTTTVGRTRDEQFRSCCERDVAHPVCRRLCSYDSLLSNFDESDYFVCLVYLRSLVGCATAGVDKTECCESKGVTSQCLGVCSGNVTNLPANYFDCMTHLSSFASCYDIPMPETPPLECPLVNCAMPEECLYGFAKNEYGCQTCECYDPCQRVFCESDFRCEPELLGESYHGVCVAEHPRINGVIKIDADFSIIDNKEKFKREIEKQISGILKLHDYVFKITGLRSGSILANFTVSAPANLSDDTAVDLLSHWTYDVKVQYNGAEYTTRLLSHSVVRPTTTSPAGGSDKHFLLLVVLVPVMVPVCIVIVVVVVVLACKMQKVERNLLSSGSRTSSVTGDSFVDDNDKTKGFDNAYCVSIDDHKAAGGASEA